MNKKAYAIQWPVLLVGIFLSLGAFFYGYITTEKPVEGDYIGQFQLKLIKSLQNGEKSHLYLSQSSKYALQQSVNELAQNGGFSEAVGDEGIAFSTNECGKFGNFNIWYRLKRDKEGKLIKISCFDENLLPDNLKLTFNKNLNEYIINYPYGILINNYDYEVRDALEIIGLAKKPLVFDILKDDTKPAIKKAKEINLQIETKKEAGKKPTEEKPAETKDAKMPIQTKDFEDFTGMDLCSKGTKCLLTKEAYELLLKAEETAKQKFKQYGIKAACLENDGRACLEVTSAYRSREQQKELWEQHARIYPDPNIRKRYVANPDDCRLLCPHETGNVVDIRFNGKTFAAMTNTDWLILEQIMTSIKNDEGEAGWVRYAPETWHFECCGTDRHIRAQEIAKRTGKPVTAIG